jgi:hypothetical protein
MACKGELLATSFQMESQIVEFGGILRYLLLYLHGLQ